MYCMQTLVDCLAIILGVRQANKYNPTDCDLLGM